MRKQNEALIALLIQDIEEKIKQDTFTIEEIEDKLDKVKFRHVDLSNSVSLLKAEFERATEDD